MSASTHSIELLKGLRHFLILLLNAWILIKYNWFKFFSLIINQLSVMQILLNNPLKFILVETNQTILVNIWCMTTKY